MERVDSRRKSYRKLTNSIGEEKAKEEERERNKRSKKIKLGSNFHPPREEWESACKKRNETRSLARKRSIFGWGREKKETRGMFENVVERISPSQSTTAINIHHGN